MFQRRYNSKYTILTLSFTVANIACDPAAEIQNREGNVDLELYGCSIDERFDQISFSWADSSAEGIFDALSKSGTLEVAVTNTTADGLYVSLAAIAPTGTAPEVELFTGTIPPETTKSLEINISELGFVAAKMASPSQVAVRARIERDEESHDFSWSPPAYFHFADNGASLHFYDTATMREKYNNGDLEGTLQPPGGAIGSEFVSSTGKKMGE